MRPLTWLRPALPSVVLGLFLGATAFAQTGLPSQLENVGLDQRIGSLVPRDLRFVDHEGTPVSLGDYLGERPVVFAPVYYDCPMLCGMVLEGLMRSLRAVPLEPGADFDVLAVSFDPSETPEQARRRRDIELARYDRPQAERGLHFLTGDAEEIASLMDAVGFDYRLDEETGEFAHVSAIMVLTPDGTVARYFTGVEYPPRDLRLSMVEAADNRIGTAFDAVLLYCFTYDPTTGRYTTATMNLVRAGGVLTLLILGGFMAVSLRRDRRRRETAEARV